MTTPKAKGGSTFTVEVSRGLAAGDSLRAVASRLGRAPSTISREVAANGGRDRYRAVMADEAAWGRAKRPKEQKLGVLSCFDCWSKLLSSGVGHPNQTAGWLRRSFPDRPELWVSHETIYQSLYVQVRGALRKELTPWDLLFRALRSASSTRWRPRGPRRRRCQPA